MRSLLIILALFGADHGELGGEGSQLSKINGPYEGRIASTGRFHAADNFYQNRNN